MDKATVEIICRALLAIVAALRKQYNLPEYRGIVIELRSTDSTTPPPKYE